MEDVHRFWDLIKAFPKDHYPLLCIDQLVYATSGCELLSMMDAYQGYHQIKKHPINIEKTAFEVCCGIFRYKSMPFGLKDTGATYQRMMDIVLTIRLEKNMVLYVDHMLVTSQKACQHERHLEEIFRVV